MSQVGAIEPFTQPDSKAAVPTVGDRILVGKSTNQKKRRRILNPFQRVRDRVNVSSCLLASLQKGNDRTVSSFEQKGRSALPAWLYHKDDWNRRDSAFDGPESGGAVDYVYYRGVVPPLR